MLKAAERYSYYGMRSILIIFLTSQLQLPDHRAEVVFHVFVAGCYLLPLAGAHLSDRHLGKYRTIMYLSFVYCFGHAVLAAWETQVGVYFGLASIAVGAGGIKPCVSSYIGDQFSAEKQSLLRGAFAIFYWMINIGALLATLTTPLILAHAGSRLAFGVPGIAMGMATLIFWTGRKLYINVPPKGPGEEQGVWTILAYSLVSWRPFRPSVGFWGPARQRYTHEDVRNAASIAQLMKVFAAVACFYALFDQHASTWVLQARDMDLDVGSIHIEPAQMQAFNPLFVLTMIPCVQYGLYPLVRRLGVVVTPLRCMGVGMFIASGAFAFVACIQMVLDAGGQPSVLWQVPANVILTLAEVLVNVTSLEFAYTQAPPTMKATVMSLTLLSVFLGNVLDAGVAQVNVFSGAGFFWFFTALMFGMAVVFVWIAVTYRVYDYAAREMEGESVRLVHMAVEGKSHLSDADEAEHAGVTMQGRLPVVSQLSNGREAHSNA